MDNSHTQLEILFLPLSSAVAALFPRQSGFRGRTPLLCLLIHSRLDTWTQTQLHIVWILFEDCIKVHAQQYLQQESACPGHLVKGVRRSSRCGLEWRYNGEVRCTMEQRLRHLRTFLVPWQAGETCEALWRQQMAPVCSERFEKLKQLTD